MPLACLAACCVIALALPAAAQSSAKQAVAQTKQAGKAQLSVLGKAGKAALAALNAQLDTLEAQFSDASPPQTVALQLGNALATFADAVEQAREEALGFVDGTAALALDTLADGGDLQGSFPAPLYYGTGGVLDQQRTRVQRAVAKLHAAAWKRLRRTLALASSRGGLGVAVELRLGTHERSTAVNQGALAAFGRGARLDVVVSASRLGQAADGVLFASGLTDATPDPVQVGWAIDAGTNDVDDVDAAPTGRFTASFGPGLSEGGYVVTARQGTGGAFQSTAAIGMR